MAVTEPRREQASENYGSNWRLVHKEGTTWDRDQIQIILLQEIRDELKQLNTLLGCSNFTNIPKTLRTIARQTKRETSNALSTRTRKTSKRRTRLAEGRT